MSASFGINKINNSKSRIRIISKYLKWFNNVSIREMNGIEVYEKYFGKRDGLVHIVDSVFLVDKIIYEDMIEDSISKEYKSDKEYIYFYILDKNEEIINLAERIKFIIN